ncbi:type II RES/Xre toxin-antitoxin system antitoxin [Nonlabens spongiae]|uniref:type II RES/Xre toxin-antitoxin system antitoxin n=1 Tax=Nonlabens spongiae TaxID=331648 RepID=UPI000A26CC8F|nr:antitoxin Xre/MbcA/ParS toxin-binding domain-containing protein [Nonlabens spongiae]
MTVSELTTTQHLDKVRNVLGKKYIDSQLQSHFDFIQAASKGVNANVIKNFGDYFDLKRDTMAEILSVSEPTIYRWTKSNKILERNFSVKLFEISELFLLGIEIFGSKEAFFKWLDLPNTSLGGMEPMELIEIPEGVSKVRDVLGRIEHGVYS